MSTAKTSSIQARRSKPVVQRVKGGAVESVRMVVNSGPRRWVVKRTMNSTSLRSDKSAAKPAGLATGKMRVRVGHARKVSDPIRELIDSALLATIDRVSAIPKSDAADIVARLRQADDPRALIFDEVLIDSPASANRAALDRAFKRAERSKAEILKQPDMLSGEQLADRISTVRATVDNRRKENKLLAIDFGSKRGFRYPEWQARLVNDPGRRTVFEQTLDALAGKPAWASYRFFTTASPQLGGKTPVEAIEAGESVNVIDAASSWAESDQGGG